MNRTLISVFITNGHRLDDGGMPAASAGRQFGYSILALVFLESVLEG